MFSKSREDPDFLYILVGEWPWHLYAARRSNKLMFGFRKEIWTECSATASYWKNISSWNVWIMSNVYLFDWACINYWYSWVVGRCTFIDSTINIAPPLPSSPSISRCLLGKLTPHFTIKTPTISWSLALKSLYSITSV